MGQGLETALLSGIFFFFSSKDTLYVLAIALPLVPFNLPTLERLQLEPASLGSLHVCGSEPQMTALESQCQEQSQETAQKQEGEEPASRKKTGWGRPLSAHRARCKDN